LRRRPADVRKSLKAGDALINGLDTRRAAAGLSLRMHSTIAASSPAAVVVHRTRIRIGTSLQCGRQRRHVPNLAPAGRLGQPRLRRWPRSLGPAITHRPRDRIWTEIESAQVPFGARHGMVTGMATTKITITLPDRQLQEIRKRVAAQESPSVSGYIQHAVQKSLENAAEFRAMVRKALKETGGPPTPKERAWAKRMLAPRKRGGKPQKAA